MEPNKLIDLNGLSVFKEQMIEALNSELSTVREQLRLVSLMADESDFKAEANFRAFHHGFDYLCIENFHDTSDIDTTKDDGSTIVANCYNSTEHLIKKTDEGKKTIQSKKFTLDKVPYDALVLIDYEGTGSIALSFSKNDGDTWISLENDTLTSLNALAQKNVRVKIEMTGQVTIKNIAWGCK